MSHTGSITCTTTGTAESSGITSGEETTNRKRDYPEESKTEESQHIKHRKQDPARNAFQELMSHARYQTSSPMPGKKHTKDQKESHEAQDGKGLVHPIDKFEWQAWEKRLTLQHYLARINKRPSLDNETAWSGFIYADRYCFCIQDMYPKASHHYLIIPRVRVDATVNKEDFVDSEIQISCLPGEKILHGAMETDESVLATDASQLPISVRTVSEHYWPVLYYMHRVAHALVCHLHDEFRIISGDPSKARNPDDALFPSQLVRTGFHVNPSLAPLHMHVISQDIKCDDSNKYCKFTTSFFVDAMSIVRHLVNTKRSYDVVQGSTAEAWIKRKDGSGKMKDIYSHLDHTAFKKLGDLREHQTSQYRKKEYTGVFCRCRLPSSG